MNDLFSIVGGTVDISGYEILGNDCFKQVCRANGNDCGGTSVDKKFFTVIANILGSENMETFKTKHTTEYLQLCSDFESAKRNIRKDQSERVNIRIPGDIFSQLVPSENFEESVKMSDYADKIEVNKDWLRLDPDFATSLFTTTTDKIVASIKDILETEKGRDISAILLVGGFSESSVVQEEVETALNGKKVIIPKDPTLAVLKGAVVYGHRPDVVTTRITQYTYGRKIKPLFNPTAHDSKRKVHIDGEPRCENIFELLEGRETAVPIGKKIAKQYHTISKTQENIRVCMYKSISDQTRYIDEEGCTLVGECSIPVIYPSDRRREITVYFEFGDTEIIITASGKDLRENTTKTFLLE